MVQELYGILVDFESAVPSTMRFADILRSAGFDPDDCDPVVRPEQQSARFTVLAGAWTGSGPSRLTAALSQAGCPGIPVSEVTHQEGFV